MAPDGEAPIRIEDSLAATYDAIQAREKESAAPDVAEAESVKEPAAPSGPAGASEPEGESPAGETEAEKAERLRADDGKFRKPTKTEKKAATAAKPTTGAQAAPKADGSGSAASAPTNPAQAAPNAGVTLQPGAGGQAPGAGLSGVTPPTSWSPAAKEAFKTLPPAVQAAVATREAEVTKGFSHYDGIRQALAPMAPALQMRGVNPASYIGQMVQLDQALSNPATRAQAFDYLARTYGYQMPQANTQGDTNAAPQQGADPLAAIPSFAALQQQVQSLTSITQQQLQAQRAQEQGFLQETQRQAGTDVEQFRADPANEFFDILRDDMRAIYERAAVMKSPMPTLKEAYDQAQWANAQTRPVMIARHQQKLNDDAAKAAGEAAAKARKSQSPNVRGSGGSTPNAGPLDMKAEMAAVYDKLHATG